MGKKEKPAPVKLIVGFIFKEESILTRAKAILERRFGKIDFESRALDFNYTNYYEKELGFGLKRKFVSFATLIQPEALPKIKVFTVKTEKKLSFKQNRLINIDPGYLNLSRLILASTKDFSHRIYLDKSIYAEITLIFKDKTFQALEWTYPDYRTAEYIEIFHKIREAYFKQVNLECALPT